MWKEQFHEDNQLFKKHVFHDNGCSQHDLINVSLQKDMYGYDNLELFNAQMYKTQKWNSRKSDKSICRLLG